MGYWKKNDRWRKEGSGPRQVIMQSPAIVATNSTPVWAKLQKPTKNYSIEKLVKLTNYLYKALYIMTGYGNYAYLSKKFCALIEWTYSRRVLAIWNHCVHRRYTCRRQPQRHKARNFLKAIQLLGRPWICQSIFKAALLRSDSSCCSSVTATAPSAITPHQAAAAACLPSYDSLEKLVEKQIFFSFFPWICSNSFNISLSTTHNLWIVYGGFTRPSGGGGGLTWL